MKKVVYGTIAIFVAIMLLTIIVAQQTPVRTVTYQNGVIEETAK
jgi:hypothetical protein